MGIVWFTGRQIKKRAGVNPSTAEEGLNGDMLVDGEGGGERCRT
jgi:hypothetical protein